MSDSLFDLELTLLGSPRLVRRGTPTVVAPSRGDRRAAAHAQTDDAAEAARQVAIPRRKVLALLAYLAVDSRPHQRARLADLLWPAADPTRSGSYLRRDLAILNKLVGPDRLVVDRESVRLRPADLWVDIDQFRNLLRAAAQHGHPGDTVCLDCIALLEAAVALYDGDFLEGFMLSDSPEFDAWQLTETENLRADAIGALAKLARAFGALGDYARAIDYGRWWSTLAYADETAHRQLIYLYAKSGNVAAVQQQYEACVRTLRDELDAVPQEATLALMQTIESGEAVAAPDPITVVEAAGASSHHAPPRDGSTAAPVSARHNLAAETLPFVAREAEQAKLHKLLVETPHCRLLTVIGPGGVGKTRLAVWTARQSLESFRDGAILVEVPTISSGTQLAVGILDAMGIQPLTDAEQQLIDILRARNLLLILDGFEHLAGDAVQEPQLETPSAERLVLALLQNAPQIKILVTSRLRLNLKEEWLLELQGLAYPSREESATITQMWSPEKAERRYGAIELFVDSAQRVQPGFQLDKSNVRAVVHVCRLIEGLPLGLELAASWVRGMSCEEIAAELDRNLEFLDSELHDMPDRHRSLQALFEHSWQYLDEAERNMANRLAVFEGAFGRKAAEAVTGARYAMLISLCDKSIISYSHGAYAMHRTLRQFALANLAATPALFQQTYDAHSAYYLDQLQSLDAHPLRVLNPHALRSTLTQLGNISAAWRWAVANDRLDDVQRCLEPLHLLYYSSGRQLEGYDVFQKAYDNLPTQPAASAAAPHRRFLLGRLRSRQARFAYRLGLVSEAKRQFTASLETARAAAAAELAGTQIEQSFCLYYLSAIARVSGDYVRAEQLCGQSLNAFQANQDRWGTACAHKLLGIIDASQQAYESARSHMEEALHLYRVLDDEIGQANTLNDLGILADRLGNAAEARFLYQQSLEIRRQIDDKLGTAITLNNLGYLASSGEDYEEAIELLDESLALQREMGDRLQIANCLANLGRAASQIGRYKAARTHFAEALTLAQATGAYPLLLELLAYVAILYILETPQALTEAATLLQLVVQHPLSEKTTRATAERHLYKIGAGQPQLVPSGVPAPPPEVDIESALNKLVVETIKRLDG